VGRLSENHGFAFDFPVHGACDIDIVAVDRAFDDRLGADAHLAGADITFDLAFDLDVFGALELAGDLQRRADQRWLRRSAHGGGTPMLLSAGSG
jgi:hypothetical protein